MVSNLRKYGLRGTRASPLPSKGRLPPPTISIACGGGSAEAVQKRKTPRAAWPWGNRCGSAAWDGTTCYWGMVSAVAASLATAALRVTAACQGATSVQRIRASGVGFTCGTSPGQPDRWALMPGGAGLSRPARWPTLPGRWYSRCLIPNMRFHLNVS